MGALSNRARWSRFESAMFVLLEHQILSGAVPPSSGAAGATRHWDFLIEMPDQERLAAWRLAENPVGRADAIAAERLADHRRVYLEYEGEISGGRGRVRRLDRGEAVLVRRAGHEIRAELHGTHLCGVYEIATGVTGQLVFRRAAAA
jgi:hypothetical protein